MDEQRRQEAEDDILVGVLGLVALNNRARQRRRRRYWVKPWLQRRSMLGQYETLFQELDRESEGDYMGYIRMDQNLFGEILQRVSPRITKGPK